MDRIVIKPTCIQTTKYGGIKAYRRAVPFFAGLILGQFIVGGTWSILAIAFNIPIEFYFV